VDTLWDQYGNYLLGGYFDIADLNGDGDADILAGFQASSDHGFRYYENVSTPGNIHFNLIATAWLGIQIPEGHQNPCLAELDSDGDLDLLVGTANGNVRYYRNDGSPTNPQMTLVSTNYLGISVQKDASPELADIDGDNDLDLFVGRSPSTGQSVTQGDVYFYRNDGTSQNPNFVFITSNYLTWDCGGYSRPLLMDVNGDELVDLLSRMGSHLIYYRNSGSPGNPAFTYESSNYGNINVFDLMPWLVDINADGKLDLIAGTSAIPGPPVMQLYLNQGTPQNPVWQQAPNPLPNVFNTFSVILVPWTADIDADGDQDLFVTEDNGYLYFFRNTGTPRTYQFQYITNNWQGLNDGYGAHRFGCFADMDGDGDLDLFMNNPWFGTVRFYRNTGTPQNPVMVPETNDVFSEFEIWHASPFASNIDLDGDVDLFVGDQYGGCRFFRNMDYHHPNPKRPVGPPEKQITILPGSAGATVSFILPSSQTISLDVFNLLGAKVATLASGLQAAGSYSYSWDSKGKASGVFVVRLQTAERTEILKMICIK
jgi:hypothetical protein